MNMWCPNCDKKMIEEPIVNIEPSEFKGFYEYRIHGIGDEEIGVVFVCEACGEEIEEYDLEGDLDE
jgi:hypothetical protein